MKPSVVYPENLIGVLKPHLKAWCSETWSASLVKHLSFFLSFFLFSFEEAVSPSSGLANQARILSLFCVSWWIRRNSRVVRFTENLLTPPHIKTCNRGTKHKQAREYLTFNPEESQVGEVPACKRQNHGAKEMYGLLQGVKNGQKAAFFFLGVFICTPLFECANWTNHHYSCFKTLVFAAFSSVGAESPLQLRPPNSWAKLGSHSSPKIA